MRPSGLAEIRDHRTEDRSRSGRFQCDWRGLNSTAYAYTPLKRAHSPCSGAGWQRTCCTARNCVPSRTFAERKGKPLPITRLPSGPESEVGMPVYTYRCESCGVQFDRHQSFHDEPLKRCPGATEHPAQGVHPGRDCVQRFGLVCHRPSLSLRRQPPQQIGKQRVEQHLRRNRQQIGITAPTTGRNTCRFRF